MAETANRVYFHVRKIVTSGIKRVIEKLRLNIDLSDVKQWLSTGRVDGGAKIFISQSVFLGHHWFMGQRREARERAVQFLFQHDLNPPEKLDEALDRFWESQRTGAIADDQAGAHWGQKIELPEPTEGDAAMRLFADPLIRGVLQYRDEVDDCIKKHAQNWELPRMAAVDRNILRLAVYEMLHREDIPPIVSINEAVDIAKKFSTRDSGKFVNGILDKVKGELLRPARIIDENQ